MYAQQPFQDTDDDEHKLQVADADEFLFRRGYDGVVLPLHERAWHGLLSDLSAEFHVEIGAGLQDVWQEELESDLGQGPRFTCDMLCDTACTDVCDCDRSLHQFHGLAEYGCGASVCLRWGDSAEEALSLHAIVHSTSYRIAGVRARHEGRERTLDPKLRVCAVPSCENICG